MSRNDTSASDPSGPDDTGTRRTARASAIAAVLLGLALVLGSAWRQGWFTPTGHLFVDLPSGAGLQAGTAVKLRGFKIGEVDRMAIEPDLVVRARLRIDQDWLSLLPAATRARVTRDGPLAARHIELLVDRPQGARLAAGARVPLAPGAEIDDVVSSVKLAVDRLALLADKAAPVLDDVRQLSAEFAGQRTELRRSAMASLQHLEAAGQGLRDTAARLAQLAGQADGDRERLVTQLGGVLQRLDESTRSTARLLADAETQVPPTLQNLRELVSGSRQASADLQQLLRELSRDLPATARAGRRAADDAQDITQGLRRSWPLSGVAPPPPAELPPFDSHGGPRP